MNPTEGDAAARREVLLPDGKVGVLLFVGRKGGKLKIKLGGRHVRVSPDGVRVYTSHLLPQSDRVMPCCGAVPGDDPAWYEVNRFVSDPARVSCPAFGKARS